MKTLHTALLGALAVSALGILLIPDSGHVPDAEATAAPEIVIAEKPMDGFMSIQDPVIEKKQLSSPTQISETSAPEIQERPVEPVQPIEERGDAMLFEAEVLGGMPFDQSITMPFD